MTTALVFGVFDRLHEGHKHFLTQALQKCDKLIVVVAQSEIVEILKKRKPKQSLEERMNAIETYDMRIQPVPGDSVLGSWEVLRMYRPNLILLGYDQKGIAEELAKQNVQFEFLIAHMPEKYKSSLLH